MQITQVRLSLLPESQRKRHPLKAYGTIVFDESFAVHDLLIIQRGSDFLVAMPNQKLNFACQNCHAKIPVTSLYCQQCGVRVEAEAQEAAAGSSRLFRDVAHPVTADFRQQIESQVLQELGRVG